MKLFKCVLLFYKSDLNETVNKSLTDFYLINCLIIHRAYIAHQIETIYELFKESKIFIKFSIYSLYSTSIALYSCVLILLI